MSVKPPQFFKSEEKDPLAAALEQEIFNEKASTLSRLNGKLEKALERLKASLNNPAHTEDIRLQNLAEAAEALWHVTIQRELCGLRQHKAFYDFLDVPREVRLGMGPKNSLLERSRIDQMSKN
ncbi:DUF6665 family protein [Roseibium sp.]|uniref:DUF6665 family protein n=1 Tax=Roseibium sp. TaxID=1936156 RepID=UPI001B0157FF|nr:hypothetical protein [Roseibium sp.]